jgi:TRAP-type mannitol/chloroaromatic compound transport system permease small subunit
MRGIAHPLSEDLPMRAPLKFAHGIDGVSEFFGKLGVYITILVIAVGFYNVAARYLGRFFGVQLSSNFWIELQKYLFTAIFLSMFAYNLKHEVNVRVDFLYAHWPPKRRALVNLLGTLLFLIPFCLLGLWVAWNPLVMSWRLWEMSPDPGGLPRVPLRAAVILAFVLLLLQGVAQAIKYVAVLRGNSEVEGELVEEAVPGSLPGLE